MLTEEIMRFRLKKLRTEANYSQKKIGEFLKVTQTTINAWEKGRQQPSFEKIYLLAKLYNVNTDYLYGIDNDTQTYLKKIKQRDFLLSETSPLSEDCKITIEDKFAEIEKYKKTYNETQNEDYLYYILFAEEQIDSILLEYREFQIGIFNILPKRNADELLRHEVPSPLNRVEFSEKQLEAIKDIKGLTDEDCLRVDAYIEGLKQGKQNQEVTQKFKNEA